MAKYTGELQAHHSRRDSAGNCYWAFRYIDFETGRTVVGKISGGESNINAIRCDWHGPGTGWASDILWHVHEHKIRAFNRMTKDWPYAGCRHEDIQRFIRASLEDWTQ